MGQAQRQEQLYETMYGNGEAGTNKMNTREANVLWLDDLVGDAIYFELADPTELRAA